MQETNLLRVVHQMVIEAVGSQLRQSHLLWLCRTHYIAPEIYQKVKAFHPTHSKLIKPEYKPPPPFPVFGQVF